MGTSATHLSSFDEPDGSAVLYDPCETTLINEIALELFGDFSQCTFSNPLDVRERIHELESALVGYRGVGKVQIKTTHTFADGLYAREIFFPKGVIGVGAIHRLESMCIVSKGSLVVLTETGINHVKAPFASVAKPGVKRVGIALEDSIWTNIFATQERDLNKIYKHISAESYEDVKAVEQTEQVVTMEGI